MGILQLERMQFIGGGGGGLCILNENIFIWRKYLLSIHFLCQIGQFGRHHEFTKTLNDVSKVQLMATKQLPVIKNRLTLEALKYF